MNKTTFLLFFSFVFLISCSPQDWAEIFKSDPGAAKRFEEKTALLKKGTKKYNKGKYKKALRFAFKAANINSGSGNRAEDREIAFPACLLLAKTYFKLNQFDSALYAIEEYNNSYFLDHMEHTLDSLQMKIMVKKA